MNLKNIKIDKEQVMEFGKKAGQLGKVVVVEGIKAVALKAAAKTITTSFDEGFGGIKQLGFDEIVGIKKDDKPKKKKLFSKKDEAEELIDVVEVDTADFVDVKVDEADVEILDKK